MSDDWATVGAIAIVLGVELDSLDHVIDRSVKNGVSAEVVLEGYRRTIEFWSTHEHYDFTDIEACPPGLLDLRVLDQDAIWVDVLRTPHRIGDRDDVTDDYLANIIGWLQHNADSLAEGWAHMHDLAATANPEQWLDSTVLMRGLRTQAHQRGITQASSESE